MTDVNLGGRYVVPGDSVVVPGEACMWLRAVLLNERNRALDQAAAQGGRVPNVVLDVISAMDQTGQRWKALHARNPSARGRSEVLDLSPAPTLTTSQAAGLLGISSRAVIGLVGRGRLWAEMVGGHWQVDPGSVEQLRMQRGEK